MKPIFLNDTEILRGLNNHDQEVFEWLYRMYWQRLFDFAYVKTHDSNVSEEIVQELFVTLWEKRETLQISNFQSYLFASVRNRVIDFYRQKVFDGLESIENTVASDYPLFLEELEKALSDAVSQLPTKTQEIFRLNRFEGQTTRQISEKLQLSERTIEYHITKALRTLKTLLKDFFSVILLLNGDSIF